MLCNSWVTHRSESWCQLGPFGVCVNAGFISEDVPLFSPLPSLENSLRRPAGIYLEPGKLKVQLQAQPNFLHQLHFSQLLSCLLGLDMQDVELPVLSHCLRHRLIQGSWCLLCLQHGAIATEALTQSPSGTSALAWTSSGLCLAR